MKRYNYYWLKKGDVFGKLMPKLELNPETQKAEIVSYGFWCKKCCEYNEDTYAGYILKCEHCGTMNDVDK